MTRLAAGFVIFADLRGGRNDADSPLSLDDTQVVEAQNIDYYEGTLGRKRAGSIALSTTFSSGGPFTGTIGALLRHVPGADETAAEFWGFDSAGVVGRLAGAVTWVGVTLVDGVSTAAVVPEITGVSFAGFLFLCYDTNQNRLHVWDPSLSKVRRVGIATPAAAPTGADDGGGALTLTRSYVVVFSDISGSDTRRISEASAVLTRSIVAKAGSTITRPTAAGEDETHWDLYAADLPTGPFYRIARTAIATTTFDDTAATITVDAAKLLPTAGTNYPPPSARYIIADQARLVMAGAWETSGGYTVPKNNRVWWTPPQGATDIGDAERIPTGDSIDVEQAITALAGPLNGDILVFAYRAIWGLTPTTLTGANAYRRYAIRKDIGCIHHKTIVNSDDENGNPCIYWLSHRGPYRIGMRGIEYLGNDIETLWATVNLGASGIVAHGCAHPDVHQIWWWISVGSETSPGTTVICYDTRLGRTSSSVEDGGGVVHGWTKHTGSKTNAGCSCLFSVTVGASMSRNLKPYIGQSSAASTIWKTDTGTDDAGNLYQAFIDTKPIAPDLGYNHSVTDPQVLARVSSGVTITVTPLSDFGLATTESGTCLLTATGAETRVQRRVEGFQAAGAGVIGFRIGDSAAVSNTWVLDVLIVTFAKQEPRA